MPWLRRTKTRSTERGLALLEVMVALVILGLVAVGYLHLLQASHLLVARAREHAQAVSYAAAGMERAKRELPKLDRKPTEVLPGGFRREVVTRHWRPGLALLTVTVFLSEGARFELTRVVQEPPEPDNGGARSQEE
jgi:prepilin-type N-terminal cleavage/methylation domain-containing protein